MKYHWLRHTHSTRLILIFAGWGTDAALYSTIGADGWDVLICYDFGTFDFRADAVKQYRTIYLYAWSLGVHAASLSLRGVPLTAAFAINGTEHPADDTMGIPTAIYHGTRQTLNPRNLEKFRRRMFASRQDYDLTAPLLPAEPDIEELQSLLLTAADTTADPADFWTRAYISSDDRIFPPANQRKAWLNSPSKCDICENPGAHYVDIQQIISNTIPNPGIVGRKFSSALSTYDSHATAQQQIIARLCRLIEEEHFPDGGSVLEIGQGSGMSTKAFAELLRPEEIDLIDLYETPEIPVAATSRYHIGDAEQWIDNSERRWDAILSSSAIQWFADVRVFLRRAADHLNPGGMLACATFAPGNLSEFDSLRPAPMLYRTADELETCLRECYDHVKVVEDEIRTTFASPREALLHLRRTGVGGFAHHKLPLQTILDCIPCDDNGNYYLTYRPIYFVARKR